MNDKIAQTLGWISVEDGLPTPGVRVLITDGVFVGEGFLCGEIFSVRGESSLWKRYNNAPWKNQMKTEITHWMPLPDAPEEIKTPFTEDAMINLAAQALGVEPSHLRELAEADKAGRVIITDTLTTDADGIGLRQKYRVYKAKDNTPVDGCFVLRPAKDPAARIAMEAYAKATENKILAEDMLKAIGDSGRCVVLPCKVGHRVFALLDTDKHISECEVKQIGLGNEIGFVGIEPIGARGREYGVSLNGFGKTVFLSREEAEKALQEMEGKKDGV